MNPFVLFGLAAAAIPVLLHLLNLRKLRTVDFSSVRFLKELQKTSIRRVRLRQMLLLVLRTLIIVAIVLAFSRPALRGALPGFSRAGASSTTVIILDDSPSMTVHDARGTAFARSAQTAARLIDLAGEGDRLYLIPLSELRAGIALPPPRSAASARDALARMAPTDISVPLSVALHTLRPLMASSADPNREVIFVSDGQATQLGAAAPGGDSAAPALGASRIYLCFSPPERLENTAVAGGEILTRIVTLRRPVRLRARLQNTGDEAVRGTVASVYCDGARVAQETADIPPHAGTQPLFSFTARRRGLLGGYVQIEDDAFNADNTWYFVLNVPVNVAVLLTGPAAADTRLASLALTLGGDSLLAGNITASQTTNAQISSSDLSRFDVIVMCGPGGLTAEGAARVGGFVRGGGGLIFFPGNDIPASLPSLFRDLGITPHEGSPVTEPAGSFLSFAHVDVDHPLFEGMFDTEKGRPQVASPRITRAFPPGTGPRGIAVISMTDGGTFLGDYTAGTGRALVFAVEAGTDWSDFPMNGLFVPLLHRGVVYAGSRAAPAAAIAPGDPLSFTVRLRTFTDRDTYTIFQPDGDTRKVVPEFQAAAGTARFGGGTAMTSGVYRLSRDARGSEPAHDMAAAAVNIAPAESDLRTATGEDIGEFCRRERIAPALVSQIPPSGAADAVREGRFGVELWKACVALAALLALAEMIVGRAPAPGAGEAGGGTA
ncbi:MAG TPA: BatA domain-containing protein [Bacteroidota bacterium]|nr:BatA domain-containing protein [Bacteroidota bacterium]